MVFAESDQQLRRSIELSNISGTIVQNIDCSKRVCQSGTENGTNCGYLFSFVTFYVSVLLHDVYIFKVKTLICYFLIFTQNQKMKIKILWIVMMLMSGYLFFFFGKNVVLEDIFLYMFNRLTPET